MKLGIAELIIILIIVLLIIGPKQLPRLITIFKDTAKDIKNKKTDKNNKDDKVEKLNKNEED